MRLGRVQVVSSDHGIVLIQPLHWNRADGTSVISRVAVAEDARTVTFTTAFDATGVDFEISKFNDDFLPVFSKVAQSVISDAMARKPVILEVLKSLP